MSGVRSAALVDRDGTVLQAVGRASGDATALEGLVAGGMVSAQALAELFGDGEVLEATLDVGDDPVLLHAVDGVPGGRLAVVVIDDMSALGRTRSALRGRREALSLAASS